MQNRSESHAKEVLIAIKTPTDLAECHIIFETQFKSVFNVKTFAKMLKVLFLEEKLSKFLGYKSRGSGQRLWLFHIPGRAKSQLRPNVRARLGPAFFGLAWPGFWPQAKAGTPLHPTEARRSASSL